MLKKRPAREARHRMLERERSRFSRDSRATRCSRGIGPDSGERATRVGLPANEPESRTGVLAHADGQGGPACGAYRTEEEEQISLHTGRGSGGRRIRRRPYGLARSEQAHEHARTGTRKARTRLSLAEGVCWRVGINGIALFNRQRRVEKRLTTGRD